MILVFLGPPGSGKGTQAKRLSQERKWPQLSTGDMLRTAITQGSQLGMEAKSFMDRGALVPDSVVIGLIAERTRDTDCKAGFILDGFPRTIPQAEALEKMLQERGQKVTRAILFDIKDGELIGRLSGRRTCPNCGAMFHVESSKPKKDGVCDACANKLIQRDDDKAEVIRKRLDVYHAQTEPLTAFYKSRNVLRALDASEPADTVAKSVSKALAG